MNHMLILQRFCVIQYFYEEKRQKYFHGRWFEHGAKTILAETANPQGLFLTNECDDNLVSSILQKVEVRRLRQSEMEPVMIDKLDVGSSNFHYRYVVIDWKTMEAEDNIEVIFGTGRQCLSRTRMKERTYRTLHYS